MKLSRQKLRDIILESLLKEELNKAGGGHITDIVVPWRNTGVSLITGIVKGNQNINPRHGQSAVSNSIHYGFAQTFL